MYLAAELRPALPPHALQRVAPAGPGGRRRPGGCDNGGGGAVGIRSRRAEVLMDGKDGRRPGPEAVNQNLRADHLRVGHRIIFYN
eukprot:1196111-Prorocentrum_minimum.AAC.7